MNREDDFQDPSPPEASECEAPPISGEVVRQRSEPEAPLEALTKPDSTEQLKGSRPWATVTSLFPMADCLTDDDVLAFSDGLVSEARRARIEVHMDGCSACQELVQWTAWDSGAASTDWSSVGWVTTFSKGSVVAGRYRITRFVARGGMGEVYEAYDKKLHERVALKTMLCAASDSPGALKRLCHEVQLARRIAHPNVCRTHELHEHRERKRARPPVHFVAMEFVDGETLSERLSRGPIPLADVFVIARQLLSGLEAAHDAGVLHLDFKSANVMLRRGARPPQAVIMDFSLSRAFETGALLRTSERRMAGSAGYMSPEQLECRPTLGPPSDVYSFGVVLFEMLTGCSPFPGDSLSSIIMQQLREPPPAPSSIVPALSPTLDAFVSKCLSRAPSERYPSIGAAHAAFDDLARDAATRSGEARPFWTVLLLAALIGLVLSSVYVARNEPPPHADERAVISAALQGAASRAEPPASPVPASAEPAPVEPPPAAIVEATPKGPKRRTDATASGPRQPPGGLARPKVADSTTASTPSAEPPAERQSLPTPSADAAWLPQKAPRNLL